MLDDITLKRIELIKNRIGLSSLDSSIPTKGSCTCIFCGGKNKAYIFDDQFYKCYRSKCGIQGDLIAIYRKIHSLDSKGSFFKAIEELESIAGIQNIIHSVNERSNIIEKMVDIYSSILWTREGKSALEYLKCRGFDEITLNMYQIGFAPSSTTLRSYGMDKKDIAKIQMFDEIRETEYFSNRIIFPIKDRFGRHVHLIGRWLGNVPKDDNGDDRWLRYKDTKGEPSSKQYLAFEHLINNFMSRNKPFVVITEGYPDSLTLNQNGIPSLGILGLEGLLKQVNKLKDFKEIIVIADNDQFDSNHPNYPSEYKSWRRLIPQLIDLQLILPTTHINWMMVPKTCIDSKGVERECKDVNEWISISNMNHWDIRKYIQDNKKDLVETLVEEWANDISKHMTLLKIIDSTNRCMDKLRDKFKDEIDPIQYAIKVITS